MDVSCLFVDASKRKLSRRSVFFCRVVLRRAIRERIVRGGGFSSITLRTNTRVSTTKREMHRRERHFRKPTFVNLELFSRFFFFFLSHFSLYAGARASQPTTHPTNLSFPSRSRLINFETRIANSWRLWESNFFFGGKEENFLTNIKFRNENSTMSRLVNSKRIVARLNTRFMMVIKIRF